MEVTHTLVSVKAVGSEILSSALAVLSTALRQWIDRERCFGQNQFLAPPACADRF
jgi:hypothetical protein